MEIVAPQTTVKELSKRQAQPEIIIAPLPPVSEVATVAESRKKTKSKTLQIAESQNSIEYIAGSLVVIIGAIALRLFWLTLKPFHHDEGVNGFFLTGLFRDGIYKYDPSNYHGPSLYYFALFSSYIFGLNDFAIRFVTVVFGVLTVALVFSLRRYLGTIGTLVAASFVALSPGLTYFSRYFIHEIMLVFFTLAVAVCILKFLEGERPTQSAIAAMSITLFICLIPIALYGASAVGSGNQVSLFVARFLFLALSIAAVYLMMQKLLKWNEGRPMYLLLASGAAVMTFTTKETSFISLGTMLIAIFCVRFWQQITERLKLQSASTLKEPVDLSLKTFKSRLEESQNSSALLFLCAVVFIFLGIVFFSSFFTNEKGIADAFEAYNIWARTGSKDHAQNGTSGYLRWLLMIEPAILILAVIGTVIAFQKAKHRFAMFAALWAFGLLAAYSIIPYKTPWIAINFVLPMALIAGYGINELATNKEILNRMVALILAGIGFISCAYQTIELNFYSYDNEQRPYVYVHSLRSMKEMMREIEQISERAGTGKQTVIVVAAPEHWPLPWTLHEYKRVGFHGTVIKEPNAEVVIGSAVQAAELEKNYSASHQLNGKYALRPGVDLLLYVRKDLHRR